tara:strand:- start:1419 stop:1805 length:387 start_codon:yes stop_codon:yes gene_type:complete
MEKTMKCILCEGEIDKKYNDDGVMYWDQGENAQPIADGQCCLKCNNHVVIPGRVVQFTVLNKISKLKERVKELSKGLTRTEPKHRNKRRNVALLKDVIDLEEKYLDKKIQLIALSSRDDAEVDLKTVL